jgi:nucleotide-binding universal stress UspA family protein
MSLQQILVPLDSSEGAEAALPIARALALGTNAVLNLVAVSTALEPGRTRALYSYLEDVAAAERQTGLRVRATLRIGDPCEAIVMLERELNVDLVVMATHGRSGLGRLLLGSVADRVTHAGTAPVILVRSGAYSSVGLETILVLLDGTPGGALALAIAVPVARACAGRVVVLRTSTSDPAAAALYAHRVAARLRRAGLHAEGRGALGLPATAIVECADDVGADLIVMSTHGRRGPLHSVLGSVADDVVRTCQQPVLLVPREAPRRAAHASFSEPATFASQITLEEVEHA